MSSAGPGDRCGAVIISFHPKLDQLNGLLAALSSQVQTIVLVDNSEPPISAADLAGKPDSLRLIQAGRNLGVAWAINRGVQELIDSGHRYAVLFDQDSLPPDNLVETLRHQLEQLQSSGQRVAAIGPAIRERGSRKPAPFIRFRLPLNRRLYPSSGSVSCDFLITSGKLIDLEQWDSIGPMREDWFIDNIDLEWSFRARRLGHELHGSCETELAHSIGQRQRLFKPLPWPCYRHHGPERLYTMMRNRVFLYRAKAPKAWVIHDSLRATGKLVLFSLIRPRRENLRAMLRGIRDGIGGKLK
jgi:rhamnosyltransferase